MTAGTERTSPTAYRRRAQIEKCLYENLLRAPYSSVSISDICRQVGISRKAFYNYYQDKDDCFMSIVEWFIRDSMLDVTTHLSSQGTDMEVAVLLLEYWRGQKDFLDIAIRNNLLHFLLLQNMRHVMKEEQAVLEMLNTPEVKSDDDILACYMTVQLTLVLQWYLRDFSDPVEEMAKKLLRILHAPLLSPVEGQ